MTIPLILLALYASMVAVALILASYNGHVQPAPDPIRRVSDAVERAAIGQLVIPAKRVAFSALLLACAGSLIAFSRGISVLWAGIIPLIAALLSASTLLYSARRLQRAFSQAAAIQSKNAALTHWARDALGALLLTASTTFALTAGLHTLARHQTEDGVSQFLVQLSALTVSITGLILSHAATCASLTAQRGTSEAASFPHNGSLTLLVKSTVHSPLLLLSLWVTISAVGQSALLAMGAATTSEFSDAWLYPHLLQLLGLFALIFGTGAARIHDGETFAHGWIRAGLVTMTLLIAGGWALAFELSPNLSRLIPAGLTFFFLSLGLYVLVTPSAAEERPSLASSAHRLRGVGLFLSLVFLEVVLISNSGVTELPSAELGRLLVAVAMASLPMVVLWALSGSFDLVRHEITALAYVDRPLTPFPARNSMTKLLGLFPLLAMLVAYGAIHLRTTLLVPSISVLSIGLAVAWGYTLGALASGQLERSVWPFQEKLRALMRGSLEQGTSAITLDLETASQICEGAIAQRSWPWILVVFIPACAALILRLSLLPTTSEWTAWCMALGLTIFGTGHAWLTNNSKNDSEQLFGKLSLVTCLAQVLLINLVISST